MANDPASGPTRMADVAVVQLLAVIKHARELDKLVDASKKIPPALTADAVVGALAVETSIGADTLQSIFNAIDNLKLLRKETDSTDAAIDRVIDTFGKSRLPGIEAARDNIRKAIDSYSDNNPVAISLKARRLSYLYEKVFIEAEFITDARPVYTMDGKDILEFVIGNSLLITYHSDQGTGTSHTHHRIHVAMDLDDIINLREACDRALLKARTLKDELGKKARVLGDDG